MQKRAGPMTAILKKSIRFMHWLPPRQWHGSQGVTKEGASTFQLLEVTLSVPGTVYV